MKPREKHDKGEENDAVDDEEEEVESIWFVIM